MRGGGELVARCDRLDDNVPTHGVAAYRRLVGGGCVFDRRGGAFGVRWADRLTPLCRRRVEAAGEVADRQIKAFRRQGCSTAAGQAALEKLVDRVRTGRLDISVEPRAVDARSNAFACRRHGLCVQGRWRAENPDESRRARA